MKLSRGGARFVKDIYQCYGALLKMVLYHFYLICRKVGHSFALIAKTHFTTQWVECAFFLGLL